GVRGAMNTTPRTQRTQRTQRKVASSVVCLVASLFFVPSSSFVSFVPLVSLVSPEAPDWRAIGAEAARILQAYVRIDTSNPPGDPGGARSRRAYARIDPSTPPGDTRRGADSLAAILERDGLAVTRYEPAPGRVIILARLEAAKQPPADKPILLLQHMDVVPAD